MARLMAKTKPYHRWMVLVPLSVSGLWFYLLEQTVLQPEYWIHIRLDAYIPFVPMFVIPYIIWYVYVAIPACYLFWKSPREFTRMAMFLALGMLVACTVYTCFPNGQPLRPVIKNPRGLLRVAIYYLYAIDTPTNSAPSIHVVYSVAAHVAITRHNNRRQRNRWMNGASLLVAVSCIVSTVFIKQHSVVDLVLGLMLSAVLYLLIYRRKAVAERRLGAC